MHRLFEIILYSFIIYILVSIATSFLFFYLSRYCGFVDKERNNTSKTLYESGVMVDGEVVLGQSYLMTMLHVFILMCRFRGRLFINLLQKIMKELAFS
jgi:hypothetical protein